MAKPLLESCRVDPGDGFQYVSSYQNVSRWKNRNRWKKFQKTFFLTNFLKGYFKAHPWEAAFHQKIIFSLFVENSVLTLKIIKPLFPTEKIPKSWPRNKILWHSDENLRKKSDYSKYRRSADHFRNTNEIKKKDAVLYWMINFKYIIILLIINKNTSDLFWKAENSLNNSPLLKD